MFWKYRFVDIGRSQEHLKENYRETFQKVLDSHWFVLGDEVANFEKEYADYSGSAYAIGVSNGLDALKLALNAIDVGPGDEVLVPSNSYIASALAVSDMGAKPVFVEPKIDTYNIDPGNIEKCISQKTKAIMPVHLYGQACEMDVISEIAQKNNLHVVEDNAQSQGSSYAGKLTGSWGVANGGVVLSR